MSTYPYAEHDNGVVLDQPEAGKFTRRPMTPAELAARDPALAIAKDIYRHAHNAGVCYIEIWGLIAKAIQGALDGQGYVSREGWIPMKERQPADFERVLCVNSNGYMTTANRFHDTHLGSWNGSDYTAEEHSELVIGDITYWMPLPASPTCESSGGKS